MVPLVYDWLISSLLPTNASNGIHVHVKWTHILSCLLPRIERGEIPVSVTIDSICVVPDLLKLIANKTTIDLLQGQQSGAKQITMP